MLVIRTLPHTSHTQSLLNCIPIHTLMRVGPGPQFSSQTLLKLLSNTTTVSFLSSPGNTFPPGRRTCEETKGFVQQRKVKSPDPCKDSSNVGSKKVERTLLISSSTTDSVSKPTDLGGGHSVLRMYQSGGNDTSFTV